jgi:hypothetical protein
MKKLAVTVTLAVATLASSSAAFADEINTDVVTTDKQAQPAPPAQSTQSSPPAAPMTTDSTTTTTSQTTTTSAPITTPIDRPSYTLKENRRPHRPLLITGGAIFVGTYATTAVAQAANDGPDRSLYIPVVGPWLHLADREGTEGETSQTILVGASGVGQGLGVALMIASMIIPEKRSVGTISAGPVKMMIGPGGAAGTF